MFLVAKFMKEFSCSLQEVLKTNWFVFNDLLLALEVVKAEDNLKQLMIADNHLLVNCKDESKYMKLYKDLENRIKVNGYSQKRIGNDLDSLMKKLRGGKL